MLHFMEGFMRFRNFFIFILPLLVFISCSRTTGKNLNARAVDSDDSGEAFPMTWIREQGLRVSPLDSLPLAPDIIELDDGTYRMFYTLTGRGVGSAVSADGLDWRVEPGLRVESLRHDPDYRDGDVGFDLGHPWVVRLDDGRWRMYMQANSGIETPLRIVSAVSGDGYDFELEKGYRVNIGPGSGPPALGFAGHGRAWRNNDGTWSMVFSGNLPNDRNPSDIMLAVSDNGLEWKVSDTCLYNNGHDPAVIRLRDGRLAIVFAYLKDSINAGFSEDGTTWPISHELKLLEPDGSRVEEIHGDVTLLRLKDGTLRLFTNAPDGIGSFRPADGDE